MQPEFWIQAWEEGKRGFHKSTIHADLIEFGPEVFGDAPGTVLVPLCGATVDLRWLADQGYRAIGVELSPIAVAELAEREGLAPAGKRGAFDSFVGDGIEVLQGDFFALTAEDTGPLAGIWDRAAMVALHPDQRAAYVALQRQLLGESGRLLLNIFEYDASKMDGPPWSIPEQTARAFWPEAKLLCQKQLETGPRFHAAGVMSFERRLFRA